MDVCREARKLGIENLYGSNPSMKPPPSSDRKTKTTTSRKIVHEHKHTDDSDGRSTLEKLVRTKTTTTTTHTKRDSHVSLQSTSNAQTTTVLPLSASKPPSDDKEPEMFGNASRAPASAPQESDRSKVLTQEIATFQSEIAENDQTLKDMEERRMTLRGEMKKLEQNLKDIDRAIVAVSREQENLRAQTKERKDKLDRIKTKRTPYRIRPKFLSYFKEPVGSRKTDSSAPGLDKGGNSGVPSPSSKWRAQALRAQEETRQILSSSGVPLSSSAPAAPTSCFKRSLNFNLDENSDPSSSSSSSSDSSDSLSSDDSSEEVETLSEECLETGRVQVRRLEAEDILKDDTNVLNRDYNTEIEEMERILASGDAKKISLYSQTIFDAKDSIIEYSGLAYNGSFCKYCGTHSEDYWDGSRGVIACSCRCDKCQKSRRDCFCISANTFLVKACFVPVKTLIKRGYLSTGRGRRKKAKRKKPGIMYYTPRCRADDTSTSWFHTFCMLNMMLKTDPQYEQVVRTYKYRCRALRIHCLTVEASTIYTKWKYTFNSFARYHFTSAQKEMIDTCMACEMLFVYDRDNRPFNSVKTTGNGKSLNHCKSCKNEHSTAKNRGRYSWCVEGYYLAHPHARPRET